MRVSPPARSSVHVAPRFRIAASCFILFGCADTSWSIPHPSTQGDLQNAVAYGYQPLDPAPVKVTLEGQCGSILDALPDETMRMAIGKVDASGNITFGPASLSAANGRYMVIIDYVKSDTKPIFIIRSENEDSTIKITPLSEQKRNDANMAVPVYVGVGMRLTANLTTREANIDLGNLVAIGAAAQANTLSGTMVIQTLGVSGENISTALPIPNDISMASIQNSIQSLGTMKAKLYDTTKTTIHPRVVGLYNNLGGGRETVNRFISTVFTTPIELKVPASACPS